MTARCTKCGNPIDHSFTGGNITWCSKCRNKDSAERFSAMDYRQKLLYPARKRAKKSGIECTITKEDIKLNKICPLLGIPIDYTSDKGGAGAMKDNSPSLDRIDSSKGYTPDNVWVISRRANVIKNDATLEELLLISKNLGEYLNKKASRIT